MNTMLLLLMAPLGQLPVVVDLPKPGTYVIEVNVKADGTASVRQLTVHKLTGEPDKPTDPPTDPTDPVDPIPDLTELGKGAGEEWAKIDDDPNTKQAFLMLYDMIAKKVRDGSIDPAKANTALSLGANAIVAKTGTGEKYKPFREWISAKLLERAGAGLYGTAEQIADTLDEIVAGMRSQSVKLHNFDVLGASTTWTPDEGVPAMEGYIEQDAFGDRIDLDKIREWLAFIFELIKLFQSL